MEDAPDGPPDPSRPEIRPWAQPWSASLARQGAAEPEDERQEASDVDEGIDVAPTAEEPDEDSWVFWDEQKRPTKGLGGLPRRREPEPLPDPMPSLTPPEKRKATKSDSEDDDEDAEEEEESEGKGAEEPEQDFMEAYGKFKSTIMDTDGAEVEVPIYETYEEAVEELRFPPFLQASLAKRGFRRLTPVQQCCMPLMLASRDFLASAFTGSGKTAAYLLPILTSLFQITRLIPGSLVAAHFKAKGGEKSLKPALARVKGLRAGLAGLEFEEATGLTHRQFVPPDWVVSVPIPSRQGSWKGPVQPYAIVLVPTRELCEQVQGEFQSFTEYTNLRSVALFGTSGMRSQLRDLAHGADILVATPGRLVDAMHRGVCKLDRVKHLVLDEVDRMMELGFGSQLQEIVEQGGMPTIVEGRQTSFWSATIPYSVREVVEAFLGQECMWVDCTGGQTNPMAATIQHVLIDARPPHRVMRKFEAGCKVITSKGRRGIAEFAVGKKWRVMFTDGDLIEHKMMRKGEIFLTNWKTEAVKEDHFQLLYSVLSSREFQKASVIVFCRKRDTVSDVFKFLKEKFEGVVLCHGGMSQAQRSKSVQALRDGAAEILVATDIAARGLDLENVTHVVNYELPLVIDEFVHRCGRTGRIGRKGTAVTFVTGREPIFKALRRTLIQQGHKVPEWFSIEGLNFAWRKRFYRPPFARPKEQPTRDAAPEDRRLYMEKIREREQRQKLRFMEKARAAMREGEQGDRGAGRMAAGRPLRPAKLPA